MPKIIVSLLAASLLAVSIPSGAQQFPSKAVTVVVPYSPGGATDTLARLLAEPVQRNFGQSVIVDNKPGADTRIANRYVAKREPDGSTVIINSVSMAGAPYLFKDLEVDVFKDFEAGGMLVDGQLVLTAAKDAPFKTIPEMVAFAKSHPGEVTWSLSSRSGEPTLYQALIENQAGIKMLQVVYKGSAPQATAILAGEVHIGQFSPGRVAGLGDKVVPMAISGDKRDSKLPNVPTMKELGYDGISNYAFGLLLPHGTPPAVVNRWNAAMNQALKDANVLKGADKFGFGIVGGTPAEHAEILKQSRNFWAIAAKSAGIEPQ